MKTLLFILCLFLSTLINAQSINFKDVDNETLDAVIFDTLKLYGDYTHDIYLFDRNRIYEFMKKNHDRLSMDKLAAKINTKLLNITNTSESISIIGIIDTVQCKNLKTYQEIASICNSHWDNPSDAFFRSVWGDKVMPVNYYDKKTGICYIFVCFE